MSSGTKQVHKMDNSSLEWAELSIEEHLTDEHFKNGRMVLKCNARLQPIYLSSQNITFNFTSDPKHERSKTYFIYSHIFSVMIWKCKKGKYWGVSMRKKIGFRRLSVFLIFVFYITTVVMEIEFKMRPIILNLGKFIS